MRMCTLLYTQRHTCIGVSLMLTTWEQLLFLISLFMPLSEALLRWITDFPYIAMPYSTIYLHQNFTSVKGLFLEQPVFSGGEQRYEPQFILPPKDGTSSYVLK